MILPKQLQNREFKFVLIKNKSKIPYEASWQQFNNYVFFHPKIKQAISCGILCGKGSVIVLDIDKKELCEEFDKKCDTFSVKTGSSKRHFYFICSDEFQRSYYVLKDGCGELRVKNSQVLCPGSTHPNGNKYEIFNHREIRKISKDEIKSLLEGYLNVNGDNGPTDTTRSGQDWREVCQMINAGYNFDDCNKEMLLVGSSKWTEEGIGYQLGTYCNALQKIKTENQERI